MRDNILHACDFVPLADGNYRAVTIRNLAELGFMAWAGALRPSAIGKPAGEIQADDYAYMESVGLCDLAHVWEYFGRREYSALIEDLRHQAGCIDEKAGRFVMQQPPFERAQGRAISLVRFLAARARAAAGRTSQSAVKSMTR